MKNLNPKKILLIVFVFTIIISLMICCGLGLLSILGVQKASANLRNTHRRDTVRQLSTLMTEFYMYEGRYPSQNEFIVSEDAISLNVDGTIQTIKLENELKISNKTTSKSTQYCIETTPQQFELAVTLEGEEELGYQYGLEGNCDSTVVVR